MNEKIRRLSDRRANMKPSWVPIPPPAYSPSEIQKLGLPAIQRMLRAKQDAIARVLPPDLGITAETLIQNALRQVMRDRRLMLCDPYTVLDSVLAAAVVGIDLVADQGFLIPYEHTIKDDHGDRVHIGWRCGFLPGYKGLLTVSQRFGWHLEVQEVRAHDRIDVRKGTQNIILHNVGFGDRGGMVGVYCVVRDAQMRVCFIETMDLGDIAKVRTDSDAWRYYPGEMARKSVVRRAYKWLPKDAGQLRLLAEMDDRFDRGESLHDLVGMGATPGADSDVEPAAFAH